MAKKGFKDSLEQFRKLSTEIKSKKSFSPVYLLMGEEAYFIDKIEKLIRENAISEADRDFNEIIFYGSKDIKAGEVAASSMQYPIMSDRVLVMVREAQNLSNIEELLSYVKSPSKTTVLVICYKGKTLDRRTQLYKAIEEVGVIYESIPPRIYEVSSIVKVMASEYNLVLEEKAEMMLIQYVGGNLQNIDSELQKLSNTIPDGQTRISDEDIEQKIGISRKYNIFELTQSLSKGNFMEALSIVQNFASNPKQTPVQMILPVLHSYFQTILKLGVILWTARKKSQPIPSDSELMRQCEIRFPKALEEYKSALRFYPTRKAFLILEMIRKYDMQSKGLGYNSATDHELLRELIIRIMATK